MLFERDGRPAGTCSTARARRLGDARHLDEDVKVTEIVGIDDRAARELWRFLLEIDWVDRISMMDFRPRRPAAPSRRSNDQLGTKLYDGLWLPGVIDVPAALAARSYATDGRVTLESLRIRRSPTMWARGRSPEAPFVARPVRPDVRLDVQALAVGDAPAGSRSRSLLAASCWPRGARRGGSLAPILCSGQAAPFCPEVF